jgi:rhodanese-related sulfurtransferase
MPGRADRRGRPRHTVLDVRTGAEHRAGHVPGAVLAPHTRLPLLTDRVPEEDVLLVHCQTGSRSASACAFLAAQGRPVVCVADDWSTWEDARLPIVREGAPTPAPAAAGRDS